MNIERGMYLFYVILYTSIILAFLWIVLIGATPITFGSIIVMTVINVMNIYSAIQFHRKRVDVRPERR
jgi:hypothetical protein